MKNSLFFLLVLTNTVFAQFKQKEVYTVYVNYPDYTIKANVSNKIKKIDAEEKLIYHWYASNKIIATTGGYDGKILDGPYTSFYISNNLKEKGTFKKGLKNGEWISWNDNGKLKEISNWKRGVKNGVHKIFDNDTLVSESYYKNDELNGTQTDYEKGNAVRKVKYRKGKEVIQKQKKEKLKTETKEEPAKEAKADMPKKTFKEKMKSFFKKKEKKTEKEHPVEKTKKPVSQNEKQKKTWKEKLTSVFNKKKKSDTTEKTAEPKKAVKQVKPQAANK